MALSPSLARSTPSTTTRPLVSVSSPPRILISVVLPDPDGPINATHSPAAMLNETPPSARSVPYCFTSASMTTCGADCGCAVIPLLEKRMLGGYAPAGAADRPQESQQ